MVKILASFTRQALCGYELKVGKFTWDGLAIWRSEKEEEMFILVYAQSLAILITKQ